LESGIGKGFRPFLRLFFFFLASLSLFAHVLHSPKEAQAAEEVKLDADSISFEESTGVAVAEGNVRIENDEMRLLAPYAEYDSLTHNIRAVSTPEGSVTFTSSSGRISGEKLDYNVETRRGLFTRPNGRVESFYVKGDSIEVMPVSEFTGVKKGENQSDAQEDLAGKWRGVVVTTCNHTDPHYRLESKELSVIPGRRVVIKKPRVYLGDALIFTYPFDYLVDVSGGARFDRQYIFPRVGYESGKGLGVGIAGPILWDTGALNMEVIWWSKDIWEGEALLRQQISPSLEGLDVFGGIKRAYDKDTGETDWRPRWGLDYESKGWRAQLLWSQRELVSLEKSTGLDSRYVVWRKPEFQVASPWFDDAAASGQFRFFATWGKYEDSSAPNMQTVERAGIGAQIYGELAGGSNFQPFYNAIYWHYKYNDDMFDSQQIAEAVLGARWGIGDFDMESAYLRRWTWGSSPMRWDDYEAREEIYQQIGVRLPSKSPDYWWRVSARGAYSLDTEDLAEMTYAAVYNHHCIQWEALYRDDLKGRDDWFGLKLTINAYPESGVRLMGSELFDPFRAPDELAPNFVSDTKKVKKN
jgi:LPS-assembly protein